MSAQIPQPETLMEAIKAFSDPDTCHEFVSAMRWHDGPECPYCHGKNIGQIKSRRKFQCRSCRIQFSVKVGTIFEDSPIGLDKWLTAMWMICNCKNGVSSCEIAREVGVTQKSAWFMLHRIRYALQVETNGKLSGTVEVDETYIGGKARNMHAKVRKARNVKQGRSTAAKTAVMGLIERGGEVRNHVIEGVKRNILDPKVREHVEAGSEVMTDALLSYNKLGNEYNHQVIDHAEKYVDGNVHTNCMENYWSTLKRTLKGTYISVEPFHLFRYLDEQCYRFNRRKLTNLERFTEAVKHITGKRLTYEKLTTVAVSAQ